jgi:hypothetical protein
MRFPMLAMAAPALVACTSASVSSGTAAVQTNTPVEPSASDRLALGAMKTRDYTVTWLSGNRLRVETAQGALVADGVTPNDLKAIDAFLLHVCTQAIGDAHLDARFEATVADRNALPH